MERKSSIERQEVQYLSHAMVSSILSQSCTLPLPTTSPLLSSSSSCQTSSSIWKNYLSHLEISGSALLASAPKSPDSYPLMTLASGKFGHVDLYRYPITINLKENRIQIEEKEKEDTDTDTDTDTDENLDIYQDQDEDE